MWKTRKEQLLGFSRRNLLTKQFFLKTDQCRNGVSAVIHRQKSNPPGPWECAASNRVAEAMILCSFCWCSQNLFNAGAGAVGFVLASAWRTFVTIRKTVRQKQLCVDHKLSPLKSFWLICRGQEHADTVRRLGSQTKTCRQRRVSFRQSELWRKNSIGGRGSSKTEGSLTFRCCTTRETKNFQQHIAKTKKGFCNTHGKF